MLSFCIPVEMQLLPVPEPALRAMRLDRITASNARLSGQGPQPWRKFQRILYWIRLRASVASTHWDHIEPRRFHSGAAIPHMGWHARIL